MIEQFLLPEVAHAASVGAIIQNFKDAIINPVITILFSLAFLIFVWGVVRFLINAEDENERAQGKEHIKWGLVGMFIMAGVFGILNLVLNTLGIQTI